MGMDSTKFGAHKKWNVCCETPTAEISVEKCNDDASQKWALTHTKSDVVDVKSKPTVTVHAGICSVSGTIKNGKWGHLLSLPPSCRPDKRLIFNLNNDDSTSRVDVQVDGRVLWVGGGKRHGHISLTGITFAVRDTLETSTTLPSQYSPVYSKQTTGN